VNNISVKNPAISLAQSVSSGERSASATVNDTLADIEARDPICNSFTAITADRARAKALAVDRTIAAGGFAGPLAGVPIAVKNLFDLQGVVTLAGSKVRADDPPAQRDAVLVERLEAAGAVVVGALNMDEHAYGFTTENTHYGPCRNPHDPSRIAGGSSGGSGAAVAAGLVSLTLGSDTNGSIRVPSSLCGIYGLKPNFGRLSRRGTYPFVNSLDHLGPMASSVADLALAYDIMQGPDADDIACAQRPVERVSDDIARGCRPERIAILGGYFDQWSTDPARAAVRNVASALGAVDVIDLPGAEQARAAAFILTAAEGGALHHRQLISRYDDYEPLSRDRLVAGSLIPANWVTQAQRVRYRFYLSVQKLFERYDLLLAAATPVAAPKVGTEWLTLNGQQLPARAAIGILTQPISCIGLPVCTVPTWPAIGPDAHLPIGVQLISAHWHEGVAVAAAHQLEASSVAQFRQV
jgi:aspartyl-tRNA(Asn)/glutamyl-tRNA(Gln) amidotransferase subunit A